MTTLDVLDESELPLSIDDGPALAETPHPSDRRGWHVWGPEMAVVVAALVVNLWSLSVNGWGNTYYAAAVRSMTQSWSNFLFASFDPGGWITVDKPPLAFWAPALSARIFGFSSWSILVPSALAGALAVWLLIITVRRVWGRTAGIVAGLGLATMPTMVAVSRSNNPDVWLVLCVVAAAWALERAVATDRLRWLVWMGVFVGLGFLAKLGAALIVAPALWLAYLVAASCSWRRRIVGAVLAATSMSTVALVWIVGVAIVPLSSRPYIGGSTDGSAWNLATGYNGIGRLTGAGSGPGGGGMPSGGPPGGGGLSGGGGGLPGGLAGSGSNAFGGATGIGRLFNAGMGDQVMWLVALAAAATLGATWLLARRRLRRVEIGSLVAWAGWAVTVFIAFSYASGIYHNYYVSLLAPAIASLVGMGASLVLRSGRVGRLVASVALFATAAIQLVFLRRIDELTALRVIVPVGLVLAAVLLAVQSRSGPTRRAALVGVGIAAAAAMVAPTLWVASSVGHAASGTFPEARPGSSEIDPMGGGAGGGPGGGFGGMPGAGGLDEAQVNWLRLQRSTEKWIVAVDSSMQASAAIIDGDSIMAIGGFSGGDASMTNARLGELVADGDLRFVMVGGGGFGGGGSIGSTVSSVCTVVSAGEWGGSGDSTIYDCAGKAEALASTAEPASPSTGTPAGPPSGSPGGGAPGGGPAVGPDGGGPRGGGAIDFEALQQCMSEKGYDLSTGPPAQDADTLAALADCGFDPQAIGAPPSDG